MKNLTPSTLASTATQTDSRIGIVLLSRAGYGKNQQEQLEPLVRAVEETGGYYTVQSAMVDQGEPSLPAALQTVAEIGATRVIVQPIFIPHDPNLHRWLAKVIMRWYQNWQGQPVTITLANPLIEHPALAEALVAALPQTVDASQSIENDPPPNWENDPAGWSIIPEHRHHLLFCRGPRCTARGAGELYQHLRDRIREQQLGQDARVLTVQTGCLYPCNLGPLLVVHPQGIWYGNLDKAALDQIVQEHLSEGRVVDEHVVEHAFETIR